MSNKASSKAVDTTLAIMLLMAKVYKTPKAALPFMQTMTKMIDDEDYIPDKMVEMPGNDLRAEKALRDVVGILLERRI